MAKQTINIGSSANDGTGDPLRTAFDKINDNFDELYGTSLTERVSLDTSPQLGGDLDVVTHSIVSTTNRDIVLAPHGTGAVKASSLKFSGTSISSDDSTQVQINEGLNVSGATTLSTSLALATGATVTGVDNGALGSSATLLATQGAIKTYVDSQVTAQDLDLAGDSGTGAIDLDSQSLTIAGGTGLTSVAGSQTVTLNIDATVATLSGSQTLTNKVITAPTINGATMTGNVTVDNLIFNDSEISSSSNANITVNPGGTGTIALGATTAVTGNASVSGTLTTADITTTGNTTVSGTANVAGDLTVEGSINADNWISNSNQSITINPAGTGVLVLPTDITHTGTQTTSGQLTVDNIKIDGNDISSTSGSIAIKPAAGLNLVLMPTAGGIVTAPEFQATLGEFATLRTDSLSTDTSNADLTIGTQGTGNIVLDTETIARTGNVSFDVSGYVVIDAGAGDIYLKDDGTNFAILSNSAGNLEIKSGNTTALSMTGANVAAQGNLTVSGAFIGSRQAISGAGAINLTTLFTELTTTGADAYSLANGTVGQVKIITMGVDGGNATITPTTFANGTSITMDAVHDSVTLIYGANGWVVLASQNITINA